METTPRRHPEHPLSIRAAAFLRPMRMRQNDARDRILHLEGEFFAR